MLNNYRAEYNRNFTEEKYQNLIRELDSRFGYKVDFKIAETPIFLSGEFRKELERAAEEISEQLFSEKYRSRMADSVPENCRVPGDPGEYPDFIAMDFAICREPDGRMVPKLIEMQGFPSLFFYQYYSSQLFRKHFDLPDNLDIFFNGYDGASYVKRLSEVLLGNSAPENTVLLEIQPEKQKTRIDFSCTEAFTGIPAVCLTDVKVRGDKLFYKKNGREIPIERIYNRVIFDELSRQKWDTEMDFLKPYDVHWVGHPAWFFRISKFSVPFIESKYVPKTSFLSETEIPQDLENYVLKPLFSFAGGGVKFDVKPEDIEAVTDKAGHILMEKIRYEPIIQTPDVPATAEIRLLMAKGKDGRPEILSNLVRLSKGKMMGVDFNKGQTWVGGSLAFFDN